MEKSGNLGRVYERMIVGVESLGHHMKFCHDNRLGYLTLCPTNLGTSLRASVHIKLPSTDSDRTTLREVAQKYYLRVKRIHENYFDISNKRRMGQTEYEIITDMYNAMQPVFVATSKQDYWIIDKSR